jgi:hypothetical protein
MVPTVHWGLYQPRNPHALKAGPYGCPVRRPRVARPPGGRHARPRSSITRPQPRGITRPQPHGISRPRPRGISRRGVTRRQPPCRTYSRPARTNLPRRRCAGLRRAALGGFGLGPGRRLGFRWSAAAGDAGAEHALGAAWVAAAAQRGGTGAALPEGRHRHRGRHLRDPAGGPGDPVAPARVARTGSTGDPCRPPAGGGLCCAAIGAAVRFGTRTARRPAA